METVPEVTKMLALRIIAEMGSNLHQRYCSAKAFTKAIGVVPANEVSGGKLLKRKSSICWYAFTAGRPFTNKRRKLHNRRYCQLL